MDGQPRILLVDDDQELGEILAEFLREDGFAPDWACDAAAAERKAAETDYDALVLDVMMPGGSGLELLKALRLRSDTPVLMLTARAEEVDRVLGLELGADDYLAKPFSSREVAARLRAILRRREPRGGPDILAAGGLLLHRRALAVEIEGVRVRLTVAEFRVLEALVRSVGRMQSRAVLTEQALGRPLEAYDRSIDTHVSNLRRKLGLEAGGGIEIRNIRSQGYVLTTGEPS
jgi:DNA-binding response OmpR family regulator